MLVSDIFKDVSGRLQDLGTPKRWRWELTDDHPSLITYLNHGVLEIVNQRPDATAVTETVTLAPGYKQTIPASASSLIDILYSYDVDGNIANSVNQVRRTEILAGTMKVNPSLSIYAYAYDKADNKNTYLVCPSVAISSNAARVEMTYSAKPTLVTAPTDTFPLPDEFAPAAIHWILFAIYSGDNEDVDLTRAQLHGEAFYNSLGIKVKSDRTYPVKPKAGGTA